MSKARPSVVLICGRGGPGHGVLRSLRALGAKTYLICDSRSGIRMSRLCERVVLASRDVTAELPATIATVINEVHAKHPIDVVMGSDVPSLALLARAKDQLLPPVFPMPTLATLLRLNDKWQFRNLCVQCGLAVPKTVHVTRPEEVDPDHIVSRLGLPVVVKPVAGSGGDGVSVISTGDRLRERIRGPMPSELLIQEFVPGTDWGLSVLARDGDIDAWTTFACGPNWATEFCEHRGLLEMGARIIRHTKFTGVANFDARLDERSGRMKLLECNPRFFNRVVATRLCGLDFVRAGIDDAPRSLVQGAYYSRDELLTRAGWKRLLGGKWAWGVASRDVLELLMDPLPQVVRHLGGLQSIVMPFLTRSAHGLAKT